MIYESEHSLESPLQEGLRLLSKNQTIRFTKYIRHILPADGFVFWVKASLLKNKKPHCIDIEGSLHQAINQEMLIDETPAATSILFSTFKEIDPLKEINPTEIWLGEYKGSLFSFNRVGNYYSQANEYHYSGDAVYPAFYSQIINDIKELDLTSQVVSNSMPFFLLLNDFPIYPSYLVPANIKPPYAVIDIQQSIPVNYGMIYNEMTNGSQTMTDNVILTLYGIRHNQAIDFIENMRIKYFTDGFPGILNKPVPLDEKRPQSEINAIAQKKQIELKVTYSLERINNLAINLIESIKTNIEAVQWL